MPEVNFDGLVGPSHNYSALAFGNTASATHGNSVSRPREAALQGISKMSQMLELGLLQGVLMPHGRPNTDWLRQFGFDGRDEQVIAKAAVEEPLLFRQACSASAMWTANAATVSPSPDTSDGRCHLTVANLAAMPHRSGEAVETERQLRLAFADEDHFVVHPALPPATGDEGAANHMRLCSSHDAQAVEIFVYGVQERGAFPARQNEAAGRAIARRHGLTAQGQLHIQQNPAAIRAGAFHNDVVAVANENVLLVHERAFENSQEVYASICEHVPSCIVLEVPEHQVGLDDAISSYLFNSQLVTLPDGAMALIVPAECRTTATVWEWLCNNTGGASPISEVVIVDVRESMRNGGGPACLRLRVAVEEAALAGIDPRFLVDSKKCELLTRIVEQYWPIEIAPSDLMDPHLWRACQHARTSLLNVLGFSPAC